MKRTWWQMPCLRFITWKLFYGILFRINYSSNYSVILNLQLLRMHLHWTKANGKRDGSFGWYLEIWMWYPYLVTLLIRRNFCFDVHSRFSVNVAEGAMSMKGIHTIINCDLVVETVLRMDIHFHEVHCQPETSWCSQRPFTAHAGFVMIGVPWKTLVIR